MVVDGRNTEGTKGGEPAGGGVWRGDGAELGSTPRELKATAEELVCRRRKTKAERRNRESKAEWSPQGGGSASSSKGRHLH